MEKFFRGAVSAVFSEFFSKFSPALVAKTGFCMYNKIVFLYQEAREDERMSWNGARDYLSRFSAEN